MSRENRPTNEAEVRALLGKGILDGKKLAMRAGFSQAGSGVAMYSNTAQIIMRVAMSYPVGSEERKIAMRQASHATMEEGKQLAGEIFKGISESKLR